MAKASSFVRKVKYPFRRLYGRYLYYKLCREMEDDSSDDIDYENDTDIFPIFISAVSPCLGGRALQGGSACRSCGGYNDM